MSVKEMYMIPRDAYIRVISSMDDRQKKKMNEINVEQLNVSCGPMFAGLKKGVKKGAGGGEEEKKKKKSKYTNELSEPYIAGNLTARQQKTTTQAATVQAVQQRLQQQQTTSNLKPIITITDPHGAKARAPSLDATPIRPRKRRHSMQGPFATSTPGAAAKRNSTYSAGDDGGEEEEEEE